jgi:hypothetical protein
VKGERLLLSCAPARDTGRLRVAVRAHPAPLPPNAVGIRRKQAAPFPNTAARQRRICDAQIRLRERWRCTSLPSRDGTSRGNPDGEAGMEAGPARRKLRDVRLGSTAPEYEKGRVRARRFALPIPWTARLRVRTPFGGFWKRGRNDLRGAERMMVVRCSVKVLCRHGRARPGHPRLARLVARKSWMPGTRPGMTMEK